MASKWSPSPRRRAALSGKVPETRLQSVPVPGGEGFSPFPEPSRSWMEREVLHRTVGGLAGAGRGHPCPDDHIDPRGGRPVHRFPLHVNWRPHHSHSRGRTSRAETSGELVMKERKAQWVAW